MAKPKELTLSQILGHPAAFGPPLEALQEDYVRMVEEVESLAGPQVPVRLHGPGRPPKGRAVLPTSTHCLRVADPLWEELSRKAQAAGLSLNQAAQQAILAWVRH